MDLELQLVSATLAEYNDSFQNAGKIFSQLRKLSFTARIWKYVSEWFEDPNAICCPSIKGLEVTARAVGDEFALAELLQLSEQKSKNVNGPQLVALIKQFRDQNFITTTQARLQALFNERGSIRKLKRGLRQIADGVEDPGEISFEDIKGQLLNKEKESPEWVVQDLFSSKMLVMIGGREGTGKTMVVCGGILAPYLENDMVFGHYPVLNNDGRILILQTDDSTSQFNQRFLKPYKIDRHDPRLDVIDLLDVEGFKIRSLQDLIDFISDNIEERKWKIVVIDNRTNLYDSTFSKDGYDKSHKYARKMRELAVNLNILIFSLEHVIKPVGPRGKPQPLQVTDVLGAGSRSANIVMILNNKWEEIEKNCFRAKKGCGVISCEKNGENFETLDYKLVKEEFCLDFYPSEGMFEFEVDKPILANDDSPIIDKMLSCLNGHLVLMKDFQKEYYQKFGNYSERQMRRVFLKLERLKVIERSGAMKARMIRKLREYRGDREITDEIPMDVVS